MDTRNAVTAFDDVCPQPYHGSKRDPSRAPTKAQSATMAPYHTAMNGIESSGQ